MQNEIKEPIIQCENLVKIYKTKDIEVLALQGLELTAVSYTHLDVYKRQTQGAS